ncbi:hypothetical protein AQJ11_38350 [Streptomyces corchorusii]|uniref:HTH hxlR-type domain-containing protein n=1 Tax=Streptomyces corchorusii TaxID=1903 RepID=A0A101PSZ0_STRCK|nr:hypothetical protein AQJ11_38350 [Streptomyces corchorusii]
MTSRRFGEFQRGLGSAENILAARLRALEQAGVLRGGPAPDGGPHREFVLTDEGRALFPAPPSPCAGGVGNSASPSVSGHSRLLDRRTGSPRARGEGRSAAS